MAGVRFQANAQSIIQATKDLDIVLAGVPALAAEIEVAGKILLRQIFQEGLANADALGGFPEPFQDHVLRVLDNKVVFENNSGFGFLSVEFILDDLGDWEDLPEAFHQGARLADGGVVWGPYHGEALAQPDVYSRYVYWYGLDSDKWQDTIQKRIEIWGDKAPEWLYAEFGQQDWEPYILPQDMIRKFDVALDALASRMLQDYIAAAISTANGYQTRGISAVPVYSRGKITVARLLSGVNAGIGPSGRPRQAGQFFPLP